MKAMILGAGRGERLRPITDTCPKPLVKVAGKPLIVYHLEKLKQCGITDIVINVHHLGQAIIEALGNGDEWGVRIRYSQESHLLDTGGGICTALPLLGKEPFLLVNGDIWTDFDFNQLLHCEEAVGEIIVVDNPLQHPQGDYGLSEAGWITPKSSTQSKTYTYAGIAVLDPVLFEGYSENVPFRLPELYDRAIAQSHLKGRYYQGLWTDVGNLERLEALEKRLSGCIYTAN